MFGVPPFKMNIEAIYRGLVNKKWITGYSVKLDTEYAAAQNRVAKFRKAQKEVLGVMCHLMLMLF